MPKATESTRPDPDQDAPQETPAPAEKQRFCERCGEPCGNAPVCATCLAQEA